jgi:putative methyltransferase (TIGR04325 family)
MSSENSQGFLLWEGVYPKLEDVRSKSKGFQSARWLERIREQLLSYRKELLSNSLVMPPRLSDLPILAAVTDASRIVDYGGSSAWAYEFLQATTHKNKITDYLCIEIYPVVNYLSSLDVHAPPVRYSDTLDGIGTGFDIFYTNSTLQYIYDDTFFFKAVDEIQPHWLLIEDFLGGNFNDFYTVQNYYESKIPVKFRNQIQFIEGLFGYDLVLSKPYASLILGQIKKLPMKNFSKDLQVEYSQTMLFKRK